MKVVLLAVLLLLVGCSGDDPGGVDPVATSPGTTSPSTSEPSTSEPSESESEPPSESPTDPALGQYVFQITISDARPDAQAVSRCAAVDPTDEKCFVEVEGLALSAKALAVHFDNFGDPPAEVADLVTETFDAAVVAYEAAEAYVAACPQAGATSDQCQTDLLTLAAGPADLLAKAVKEWKPYL